MGSDGLECACPNVGIEFAQMYGRFGTRVTLLGRNAHLAPSEDPELSELLAEHLREEGIDVHASSPLHLPG